MPSRKWHCNICFIQFQVLVFTIFICIFRVSACPTGNLQFLLTIVNICYYVHSALCPVISLFFASCIIKLIISFTILILLVHKVLGMYKILDHWLHKFLCHCSYFSLICWCTRFSFFQSRHHWLQFQIFVQFHCFSAYSFFLFWWCSSIFLLFFLFH